VVELAARLLGFVRDHRLGTVLNGGFELVALPRTIRVPDIAFISSARASRDDIPGGFVKVTPDFVVEVLSPSDRKSRIQSKLDDYRRVRIPLVWLIDPKRRTVSVMTPRGVRVVRDGDVLDGGSVLPGFSCPVGKIFEGLR
jgi:Uma2 family endonuclease